ncbi:helix-turn-helix domain-containing protein [Nocardia transvalensis]|uniref:helix-turn-helix domain-containing protein n=1 Tax=Nocardia transvalensis TaxID=37333 RepID=UPI001C3F3C4D|nr:helix-turn-helix domain-containing protein [Nocardia transvalensis]
MQRRFKEATGLTTTEYIQAARIAKAREALELTNEPVARISRSVGYLDVSNFRRLFSARRESRRRSTATGSASRHAKAVAKMASRVVSLRGSAGLPPNRW